MVLWLLVFFHLSSLLFCLLATRTTFRYLNKHRIVPRYRYKMFGRVRTRDIALVYVVSIVLISSYALVMGIYYAL